MDTKEIFELINQEEQRQENEICLIASENYTSKDVMKAQGSCLTQKYAEGYPGHRYYAGCEIVDKIEQAAIDNACELFNCKFANVQPHSGASANLAVLKAFCNAGDTILGMSLDEGGHLTHGAKPTISGKWFSSVQYGLDENGYINYNEIKEKLYSEQPRLLIIGASAYPREIDFKKIREMVDEYNAQIKLWISFFNSKFQQTGTFGPAGDGKVKQYCDGLTIITESIDGKFDAEKCFADNKCYMMVDMAHIAGLVAAGLHQSPLPYADVVTSTTHKTLRGPRGGIILWNNEEYTKKINSAVFPGCQGGPLEHVIAGKAICFAEALQPEFKEYTSQILKNIKAMCEVFNKRQVKIMTNGSDVHLLLLDLRNENFSGADLEKLLESVGIITNKNSVKGDIRPKMETSGLRIGTAACTTRGAKESDCKLFASWICDCIELLKRTFNYKDLGLLKVKDNNDIDYGADINKLTIDDIKRKVKNWCKSHPIY